MSGREAGTTGRADWPSGQNGHAPGHALVASRQLQQGSSTLPMLASACPGWVCYAEKTHGNTVLPFISTTRSPQVLFLVTSHTCSSLGLESNDLTAHGHVNRKSLFRGIGMSCAMFQVWVGSDAELAEI